MLLWLYSRCYCDCIHALFKENWAHRMPGAECPWLDFILRSLKRGMGRSISLSHVPCYCTKCVRRACQEAPTFTFCPCCTWLVHHISNGKKPVFQIYFWNMIYNHLSSNWQSTVIIDSDKKKTKKTHPTSWCGFFLLTDSLRIAPTIQPRVRKLGRALDWKGAAYETLSTVPFYFKVWDSCGVLADCLLWKSLGYNRKT